MTILDDDRSGRRPDHQTGMDGPPGRAGRPTAPEAEAERMRLVVERWTTKHLPETDPEEALIRSAAMEHVRYLRCVEADERALRPSVREALAAWEEKRRHAIRRKAQGLKDDPEGVRAELLGSAFGIDWMVRHWKTLLGLLDSGKGWRGDELILALRLLGRPPHRPAEDDAEARPLWDDAASCCPATLDCNAPRGLSGDRQAAGRLRAFIVDQVARLDALRPAAWDEVEGPEAEAVEAAAMVDVSKEGQARQRHRRDALRDMNRCLSLILRLRVARSRPDGRPSGPTAPDGSHPAPTDLHPTGLHAPLSLPCVEGEPGSRPSPPSSGERVDDHLGPPPIDAPPLPPAAVGEPTSPAPDAAEPIAPTPAHEARSNATTGPTERDRADRRNHQDNRSLPPISPDPREAHRGRTEAPPGASGSPFKMPTAPGPGGGSDGRRRPRVRSTGAHRGGGGDRPPAPGSGPAGGDRIDETVDPGRADPGRSQAGPVLVG